MRIGRCATSAGANMSTLEEAAKSLKKHLDSAWGRLGWSPGQVAAAHNGLVVVHSFDFSVPFLAPDTWDGYEVRYYPAQKTRKP
jgi:hypothetical protein